MIEQLKTLREALEDSDRHGSWLAAGALVALTQLEAMVGEQEPVGALLVNRESREGVMFYSPDMIPDPATIKDRFEIVKVFTAPVAQQYEAGDMASAAAQGFRDGVASVTQQKPVDLIVRNCCEAEKADPDHPDTICISVQDLTAILEQHAAPVAQQPTFDARRALEAIEALLSNIRRDAPSLSGKVMGFAEEVAAALRDKVARQPQARPDFTDEWAGYLKDGETPFERFLRERKDLNALTKLYQRALEENERLKAQQPQADTPQATTIAEAARDVGKWLNERPNRPIDLRHVAMLVAHAMQPQAEAVQCSVNSVSSRMCEKGTNGCDTQHAPQQAEAVPLTHVLVPVDEPTDEMVDAACAAVDGLCRVDFVRAYVAAFAHLKAGYRDESYWCGWNAAIKFQQAESAHQYNLANRLRVHLANRHTLTGPEFKDGVAGILAEYYTAPQQAEAVPTFDEQLREVAKRAIPQQAEAVPFNHATQLQIAYVKGLGDGAMQAEAVPPDVEVIRKALERAFIMGQNYWADADSESYSANKRSDVTRQKFNAMRDEVCAAIAQQKGQL